MKRRGANRFARILDVAYLRLGEQVRLFREVDGGETNGSALVHLEGAGTERRARRTEWRRNAADVRHLRDLVEHGCDRALVVCEVPRRD